MKCATDKNNFLQPYMSTIIKVLLDLLLVTTVFALTACGSKLTEDNLQKIHNGMTQQEVKAILGPPTDVQSSGALGITGTTFTYHRSTSEVKITFLNDSVMATEGEFK